MKKVELLKEIETGWYVEDIALKHIDKISQYITGDSDTGDRLGNKMSLTSVVREKFFAKKECKELAVLIKNNGHGNTESFRLCEAVFAESIASPNYPLVKLVLHKIHEECKGLSEQEIERYLELQVKELGSSSVKQLATTPVLKKDVVAGGRNASVE